jgi:hypothetical protein
MCPFYPLQGGLGYRLCYAEKGKTMKITTMAVFVLVCAGALGAWAQSNPLPLGIVTPGPVIGPCSSAIVPNHSMFGANMTCADLSVTSCSNTQKLDAIYGYYVPANPKGTIVLFSGGPGTMPAENAGEETSYANDYEAAGYAVVQIEWGMEWEDPTNGSGGNILNAACRPATFLNWVNTNPALRPSGTAMCSQGGSAGSAAIAYSLAWYGAGSYMTNVELLSGPVLSEIDQGCTYPNALNMPICSAGQYGCTAKTIPWSDYVIYVPNYNNAINGWSGLQACGTSLVNPADYPKWAMMSIVDGSSGSVTPIFNYPNTTMHGWICQDYAFDQFHDRECFPPIARTTRLPRATTFTSSSAAYKVRSSSPSPGCKPACRKRASRRGPTQMRILGQADRPTLQSRRTWKQTAKSVTRLCRRVKGRAVRDGRAAGEGRARQPRRLSAGDSRKNPGVAVRPPDPTPRTSLFQIVENLVNRQKLHDRGYLLASKGKILFAKMTVSPFAA